MKTIAEIVHKAPVWVNPEHRVESAIWLMRGHDIGGLPVLEGYELVGMLLYKHLLGVDVNRLVREIMETNVVVASATMSVRRVAELMTREKIGRLPIVNDENRLIGVVTYGDLLDEMRRSADPITDLSWSDSLHDWAIEELRLGREITVLFLDVNDFGQFNKRFGHVVGDMVLRSVANVLRDLTDPTLETVCRYGGDEFCIATLRSAEQASALAAHIAKNVAELHLIEAREEAITVTIGQRGGRRTREREHIHYAATLNNLINLASQDCMLKKVQKASYAEAVIEALDGQAVVPTVAPLLGEAESHAAAPYPAGGPKSVGPGRVENGRRRRPHGGSTKQKAARLPGMPLRLATLDVSRSGGVTHVRVELERVGALPKTPVQTAAGTMSASEAPEGAAESPADGQVIVYGSDVSGVVESEGLLTLVAEATIVALRRALGPGQELSLEEVVPMRAADGRTLMTIVGHLITAESEIPITGSAVVNEDAPQAVAEAVLAAADRHQLFAASGSPR